MSPAATGFGPLSGGSRGMIRRGASLALLALACPAEGAVGVRGVSPEDQAKYAGAGGSFRCFSGSAGSPALPLAAVNDDFCDCGDGSDEPGTSACAGQKETLYYCVNEGSDPAYLYSSRVNDGICDCCDGSDEWGRPSGFCKNTCSAEGYERKRERQRLEGEIQAGMKQRRALIAAAKTQKSADGRELTMLEGELPGLEAREKEAEAKVAEAQRAHDEERARNESKATTTTTTTTTTVVPEPTPAPEAGEGKVVSEYTKWMDGAEEALKDVGQEEPPAAAAGGEKVVSEYTKWMDGAEEVLKEEQEPSAQKAAPEPLDEPLHEDDDDDAPPPAPPGFIEQQWDRVTGAFSRLWRRFWRSNQSPAHRALEDARTAKREAKRKADEARNRIRELKDKVAVRDDDEEKLAYSGLDGRCISKKFADYNYEVCFFSSAKQDSVSIGHWKHWEAPSVALFDNGQHCPGGLERSLRVHFKCATKEELLDVSEPSRCAYAATLAHPAACTEALAREIAAKVVRMPTDEL